MLDVDRLLRAAAHGDLCAIEVLGDHEYERGRTAQEILSSDAEASGYGDGDGDGSGSGYGLQISISQAIENDLCPTDTSSSRRDEEPHR